MQKRRKKTILVIILVAISLTAINNGILQAESFVVEPIFFSLEARYLTTQQHECLNLVKQYLARIGINLDLIYFNISESNFLAELIAFRDFDLTIIELPCSYKEDPFTSAFFAENGTLNLSGYHTSMDWDENLGTGRNEWYIQTGLPMTPNDSQERINLCWEWQHYMMDDILPILPLFTQKDNHSTFEFLFFNMREVRPIIGSRDPAPGVPSKSRGLLLRKAISYAINREEIRRVVYGDEYEIIHHPTNPVLEEWLNPSSIRYCYNLNFARKLMSYNGFDYPTSGEYPEWEEICSSETTTADVTGFNVIMVLVVLTFSLLTLTATRMKIRKCMKKILIKK